MTVPLSAEEYETLKRFLDFYTSHYMPIDMLPPEMRPLALLNLLEQRGKKQAHQGMLQAISDGA